MSNSIIDNQIDLDFILECIPDTESEIKRVIDLNLKDDRNNPDISSGLNIDRVKKILSKVEWKGLRRVGGEELLIIPKERVKRNLK